MDLWSYVRSTLAPDEDGGPSFLLSWEQFGCQVVSHEARKLLPCPAREAIWQCEVIGPHERHQFGWHTIAHERLGNGYTCQHIGEGQEIMAKLVDMVGDPWADSEEPCPDCGGLAQTAPWWDDAPENGGAVIGTLKACTTCRWYVEL